MARQTNRTSHYKNKSIWGVVFVFAMLIGTIVVTKLASVQSFGSASAATSRR